MRRMMDRVYDENLAQRWNDAERAASPLALDVKESDEAYVVKATLPGIDPQDVEITYTNKTLTIQGELKSEEEHENERYQLRERYSGKFYRQLRLPFPINEEAIDAKYEHGILTLTLPKSEELKPKKIVVQAA
jgi:HSP20 family protein